MQVYHVVGRDTMLAVMEDSLDVQYKKVAMFLFPPLVGRDWDHVEGPVNNGLLRIEWES